MPDRHLPVRPNLEQLKHQAKDLLRALRRGDAAAIGEFERNHPRRPAVATAKLADAQLALARSYGLPNWPRLVTACRITDAIWRDDVNEVRKLVLRDPRLLTEDARGVNGNWGRPLSYAANLGRDQIIAMLRQLGAQDLDHALDRALLQGRVETAKKLLAMGAQIQPDSIMGPCETLNPAGLQLLLDLGVEVSDGHGDGLAPIALLLQTYARNPKGKHGCLELLVARGIELPDTPPMAVHRGRIDLLEAQFRRDPTMLRRTWSHGDIYPPSLGCSADHSLALHGTPLAGTTLLHMCADFNEIEIARWLLEHGADVNARAEVDRDGFGGHTALFGCVVSQAARNGGQNDGEFTRLLLDAGADPNARASLRKRLRFHDDDSVHEYRDVTPLGWGERFHGREWVNPTAMRLIAERGGSAS